jgi:hypothetical protein
MSKTQIYFRQVLAVDQERRRYEIQLDSGVKKIKAENVQLATVVPINARVELCGLKSAANLNGERAAITAYEPASGRYEIRMEMDSSTKQVKRVNFKPLA